MKKKKTTRSALFKGAKNPAAASPGTTPPPEDLVMSLVAVVRMEVEDSGRRLDVPDSRLAEAVLDRVRAEKRDFAGAGERNKYYGTVTREVVWNRVNAAEAENIIGRLKSGDRLFAQKFFYGTSNSGCNVSRLRSKITAQIRQTYQYEMSVEEFGNIVYTHLWDNGTWGVLDSYAGRSSFFHWLEQVSRHEVVRTLGEMKVINAGRGRTAGNTRLLGASIPAEVWDLVISDLMPEGLHRDLLEASYVKRQDEETLADAFGMELPALRAEMKKAEASLRDRLIRGGEYYEDLVLRDKAPRDIEVSGDFVRDFVKWQEGKTEESPLSDVLGVNLGQGELRERVADFLYEFSSRLKWSDEDKLIWRLRFIENTSPAEVAERCGKARPWLDTRYSRLRKKFNAAVREWWKSHSE